MNEVKHNMMKKAFTDALPIILGYIPMGAAYGILARQSGMGLFTAIFMSIVVFVIIPRPIDTAISLIL